MNRSLEKRRLRRALAVNNEIDANSATGRAARAPVDELAGRDIDVLASHSMNDAAAIAAADASLQVISVDRDLEGDGDHAGARPVLGDLKAGGDRPAASGLRPRHAWRGEPRRTVRNPVPADGALSAAAGCVAPRHSATGMSAASTVAIPMNWTGRAYRTV